MSGEEDVGPSVCDHTSPLPSPLPSPPSCSSRAPRRPLVCDHTSPLPALPPSPPSCSSRAPRRNSSFGRSSSESSFATPPGILAAQRRVQAWCAKTRKAGREERKRKALAGLRFEHIDLEAFRLATLSRLAGQEQKRSGTEADTAVAFRRSLSEAQLLFPQEPTAQRSLDPLLVAQSHQESGHVSDDEEAESPSKQTAPLPSSLEPLARASTRRRIAIVGGGPVGLWATALIAQRHARKVRRASGSGCIRVPDAPEFVIFEQREKNEHCSRRNVYIALDTQTTGLLNKHAKPQQFTSGVALAKIESALVSQVQRLTKGGCIEYGSPIENPLDLLAKGPWDMVLWAAGRRSLDAQSREKLGCGMSVGDSDDVLVFEMRSFCTSKSCSGDTTNARVEDLAQLARLDLTPCARQAALCEVSQDLGGPCNLQIILRYAVDNQQQVKAGAVAPIAWLWILGVPSEFKEARAAAAARQEATNRTGRARAAMEASLGTALDSEFRRIGLLPQAEETTETAPAEITEELSLPTWAKRLRAAVAALQPRVLHPREVSLRWVEGSYWSSEKAVCSLPPDVSGRNVPLLLLGDAALGKPFYTGTTLNMHIAEVKALSKLPVMRWGRNHLEAAAPGVGASSGERGRATRYQVSGEAAALRPFLDYERRYRELIARTPAFRRRTPT